MMTESFDTIEAYLKQANLKLDKILFELNSTLEQCAKEMQIPPSEQCSPDNISMIPGQLEELRARYQYLQTTKDEASKMFSEKLSSLEQRVATLSN